jgi:hypothetical protein
MHAVPPQCEGERKNGVVVLLAELLGSVCNLFGWLGDDRRGPVEPEEFSSRVAGLEHAGWDDGERLAGSDPDTWRLDSLRQTCVRLSGIAILSKLLQLLLSLERREPDPTPEFGKTRVRMEIVQTLIHREIRQ